MILSDIQFILHIQNRHIPTTSHFELFYAPKFYTWVNTVVPNKFHDLKNDHPRLVIPFFDEKNNMFAFQGRAFGNEQPKYITIVLDSQKEKIYGLNRVDWKKTVYVVEGPIDSLFLDNCIATAQSDLPLKNRKDNILCKDKRLSSKKIARKKHAWFGTHDGHVLQPDAHVVVSGKVVFPEVLEE